MQLNALTVGVQVALEIEEGCGIMSPVFIHSGIRFEMQKVFCHKGGDSSSAVSLKHCNVWRQKGSERETKPVTKDIRMFQS